MTSGVSAQQAQTNLLVSTGGSIESNPYNDVNSNGAQIAATADFQPTLRLRDEKTTIDLHGLAQFRQFLRRFGLEDNYSVDGSVASRITDRISVHSNAAFSYNEGGFGFGRPQSSPSVPATFEPDVTLPDPLTGLSDVSILGGRNRVTSLNGSVGANGQLSAYSALSLNLNGRALRFKNAGFGDYNNIGAELSFTHELSEFTSVGLISDISRTDYLDTRSGDARTISFLGTLERRLGARWSLSASAGLSLTAIDQLLGQPDTHYSSLTTRLRFCREAEFSRFCVNGNRSPEPSANGSVRVSNALEANYWRRLSDRDSFTLAGSFARTGKGWTPGGSLPAIKFVSASGRYDRTITQTMTGFLGANFAKTYFPTTPRRANVGVTAGVQFRFGALQ